MLQTPRRTGNPFYDLMLNNLAAMMAVPTQTLAQAREATTQITKNTVNTVAHAGSKPQGTQPDQPQSPQTEQRETPYREGEYRATRDIGQSTQEVFPVLKEELRVSIRPVESNRGVRVITTVREHPVERTVTLRNERIYVERRPARTQVEGRPHFADSTIELRELHEIPVVEKVVTQTEEIVIRRQTDSRTETIRDTVRETSVEVEEGTDRVVRLAVAGNKPRKADARAAFAAQQRRETSKDRRYRRRHPGN